MSQKQDELLTVGEVANILRVDNTTVCRWIRSGALEAVILPHPHKRCVYRIRQSVVQSILDGAAPSGKTRSEMIEKNKCISGRERDIPVDSCRASHPKEKGIESLHRKSDVREYSHTSFF